MSRIIVTNGVPDRELSMLEGHEVCYPGLGKAYTREDMLRLLPGADAVLACSGIDRGMFEAGRGLKLVVCYGAGYDYIDMRAATELGVPVANMPETVTEATAELAISLILACTRRVAELDALMRTNRPQDAFGLGKRMGVSLRGLRLGIVGIGRIGARVADFGRFMGMEVVYAARSPKPEQDAKGARRLPLDELMHTADVVSLHCPLTPETRGLISRDMLMLMKRTAFLINTSRGAVVDENALIEALRGQRIAGAGLDVYMNEPNITMAFRALSNVVTTPHAGSNTVQTRDLMMRGACERILDALAGRRPEGLLNPEVWRA